MGGICSRRAIVDNVPSSSYSQNGGSIFNAGAFVESNALPGKVKSGSSPSNGEENVDKQPREPFSFPEFDAITDGINESSIETYSDAVDDGIPRFGRVLSQKSRSTKSRQVAVGKVSEMSSLLGKAGTVGLGKAVEVLDTLGSSMTSLHLSSGFVSGVTTKGNKIGILAFEVANTIVKGSNLMQSLSKENVIHLKEVVLRSEGIKSLISKDIDELQRIAAADKREELKVFSGEVIRFGNRCKDPQYHNLDRYFEKLASELTPHKLKDEAETIMQNLVTLVQYTAELYHESHALDRFEQDYKRKLQEEENPSTAQRGDSLAILRAELKSQRKHVRSLKKKSLWSRILEDVMEKLVDIVHFLHLEIHEAFGSAEADKPIRASSNNHQRLGSAGLALHYANIITQIDTLVSRSNSVPPNTRDALYQGLPPNVKASLRSKVQSFQLKEEFTVQQIKAEMERTLYWLVPIATNTTKAHHGFGWVGEWANTGSDVNRKTAGQNDLLRIETLYHADKEKTETYILDLVVWLHHLVSLSKATSSCGTRSPIKSPMRSPNQTTLQLSPHKTTCPSPTLSIEDQQMLCDVTKRKLTPGISKSQEFDTVKSHLSKHQRLSKSNSHSPTRETKREIYSIRRPSSVPIIDFGIDRSKALDVIDRVDTL
ncbi:protein PSK SIMULATOR 1 isoform X2 [Amaranthus tricolor]|uniref:protein PSK SIMULATOR 1 isoform X2 n=1 Tax=Amaranthus tricolor TaxID=29722 RepID=UPI00258F3E32|nr:protein PSK SIMULATOR 1 isoform X2 [Amaranthus tricolor]